MSEPEGPNQRSRERPVGPPVESAIAYFIDETRLIPQDGTVVLGVSGGPDSVALLLAISTLAKRLDVRWDLHVAHLNHGLRADDSDQDADFVAGLSAGIPAAFHVARRDVAALAREMRVGIEEAARRARYDFFRRVAREVGAHVVALGHTLDDQVETVLHRVFRGTGIRGLRGIPAARPLDSTGSTLVVRPLLRLRRSHILTYLAAKGQTYRTDATNLDTAYRRNWLRRELLPAVEGEYGKQVGLAVARLAGIADELMDYVEAEVDEIWDEVLLDAHDLGVDLDRGVLASVAPALMEPILRRAWRRAGLGEKSVDFATWARLAEFVAGSEDHGALSLPGAHASRVPGRITIRRSLPAEAPEWEVGLPIPGRVQLADAVIWSQTDDPRDWPYVVEIRAEEQCFPADGVMESLLTGDGAEELVDLGEVVPPLVVRPRRAGDIFRPLGAPGQRKLKCFFIDCKVARGGRDHVPLVVDQAGIVWVAGLRIAERVRITPATRRVLKLSASRIG